MCCEEDIKTSWKGGFFDDYLVVQSVSWDCFVGLCPPRNDG